MTVLDDVLEWSQRLEEVWLRDALRRLVVQGALSVEDRRQLFEMSHDFNHGSLQPG